MQDVSSADILSQTVPEFPALELKGPKNEDATASIYRALILEHIDNNCKKLMLEITSASQPSSSNLVKFFKYPNASYLTARMFRQLE